MAGKHDHGCKRIMRVPAGWQVEGEISDCEQYRYKLSQRWADGPLALFCMMNPSGADLEVTDATVSKCARMANGWGYGGLMVANACAYRATDKNRLLEIDDPVGPRNSAAHLEMAAQAGIIVIAHGRLPKGLEHRADTMTQNLRNAGHTLHVLRLLGDGVPTHPLARGKGYVPEDTEPVSWPNHPVTVTI